MQRRDLVYAHQGGAKEAPSSTMAAFRRAVRLGCPALEMDVHMTKDGHLVVTHDETVDRTSAATGRIDSLTLGDLRELDNAYWFVPGVDVEPGRPDTDYPLRSRFPEDRDYGFATLCEVLDAFPEVYLNFDIKETAPDVRPYERVLADALRAYGRVDDVIVASFHDSALRAFRNAAPEVHTSTSPEEVLAFGVGLAGDAPMPELDPSVVAFQVPTYFGEHRIVDERFVVAAHEHGYAVHVWTVDEPDEMHELLDLGVDALITDVPWVALQVLVERSSTQG